jgi:hypothetical protein
MSEVAGIIKALEEMKNQDGSINLTSEQSRLMISWLHTVDESIESMRSFQRRIVSAEVRLDHN